MFFSFKNAAVLTAAFSSSLALAVTPPPGGSTLSSTPGKAFNPDVSVNFLGLLQRSTRGSNDRTNSARNGFVFQEAEMQFTSDVDPYFRASALFSLTQPNGKSDFSLDPEEVFFESISLPVVTIRAGKFKAAFGRHNQLHTHAFPFIDAPLINQDLLGDEGLNEVGVSASALIPTSWFSELTFQALGTNNERLFKSPSSQDLAGLAYLKNLWDLSEDLTLELGLYGVTGANQFGSNTSAYGSDLTFKWRPAQGGKYTALLWQTEYLRGNRALNPDGESLGGLATWVQYQFAERWWIQGRYEYEGIPTSGTLATKNKQSALIGFFPSEFSGFRIQYDRLAQASDKAGHRVALQWNISIGAHPAHAY